MYLLLMSVFVNSILLNLLTSLFNGIPEPVINSLHLTHESDLFAFRLA